MGLHNRRLAEETPADEKEPLSVSSLRLLSLPWGVSIQDAELKNAFSPWVTPHLCLQGGCEEEKLVERFQLVMHQKFRNPLWKGVQQALDQGPRPT